MRSLRPHWILGVVILVVAVAYVVQSHRDSNKIDPELTARTLLEDELARQGVSSSSITDVSCVKDTGRRFECVVTVTEDGTVQKVGGTLLCDDPGRDAQCLWRGALGGG